MKKIILLAVLFFNLISCKKNSDTNYYIKANIGGTQELFTEDVAATNLSIDNTAVLFLSAKHQNDVIVLRLFYQNQAVSPGTYTQQSINVNNVSAIEGTYKTLYSDLGVNANPPFKIAISQIDDKSIHGNFEGRYFDSTSLLPDVIITKGEFNLPFK